VQIRDTATWELIATLTGQDREIGKLREPEDLVDGTWLVDRDDGDGSEWLWDLLTGQAHSSVFTDYRVGISAIAVASDGTWLATAGGAGTVRIWDTTTWQSRTVLAPRKRGVSALAVAPDGSWLAAGGNGEIRIWETATWKTPRVLASRQGWVSALAASPDGTWLAAGGRGVIEIWDVEAARPTAGLPGIVGRWVRAIAVAPDGSFLVGSLGDGTVQTWDRRTWEVGQVIPSSERFPSAIAVAPDGADMAPSELAVPRNPADRPLSCHGCRARWPLDRYRRIRERPNLEHPSRCPPRQRHRAPAGDRRDNSA
jgi:WD40 repeat protein